MAGENDDDRGEGAGREVDDAKRRRLSNLKPFKKGYDERRNLGGHPQGKSFASLKQSFLMEIDPDDPHGRPRGLIMLEVAYERGVHEGSDRALKDLLDRLDGKAHQTVTLTTEARDKIELEVQRMIAEAAELGEAVTRLDALRALRPYVPGVDVLIEAEGGEAVN